MSLAGKVCLVTGATRGVGKGIALQLGQAGATVYITGRTAVPTDASSGSLAETEAQIFDRGGKCIAVVCDHSNDEDVKRLFEKIKIEQHGQLDLLVNNAYSAVQILMQTWGQKFWELEAAEIWDAVNDVGLRNVYLCSVYAARMMVERKRGLIVNISSAGGLRYIFSVPYGVGKAGVDRLAADCAVELKELGVACVSLWPGAVESAATAEAQVKLSEKSFDTSLLSDIETPEFEGMAVVQLLQDRDVMKKTGRVLITADLSHEYGFRDITGRPVPSMRQVNYLLRRGGYNKLASFVPSWIKLPYWVLALAGNKF